MNRHYGPEFLIFVNSMIGKSFAASFPNSFLKPKADMGKKSKQSMEKSDIISKEHTYPRTLLYLSQISLS